MKPTLISFIVCALLLSACKNEKKDILQNAFIKPPIPELDIAFKEVEFDATQGGEFRFKGGARVVLPASALTDQEGNLVTGKAKLKFREFHDAGDIYLAGIPMRYDSAGQKNLETAGMFEIRCEQGGVPLKLKQGMSAKVDLATQTAANGYNTYFLDESKRNWSYMEPSTAVVNAEKSKLLTEANRMTPRLGFPLNDSKYFALNYNMILDILFNQKIDSVNHEEVKAKMMGYGLGWLKVYPHSWIKYQGREMPASMVVWKKNKQVDFPGWVDSKPATVSHLSGNQYLLKIFTYNTKDTLFVEMEAVMLLNELFRFPSSYWKGNYATAMKKVTEMRESASMMADLYRSAAIDQFGIYNYDRLLKEEGRVEVLAEFDFEGLDADEEGQIEEVVFVPSKGKALVKLDKHNWSRMPLVPDAGGRLFALLPGKRLAIYDVPKYSAIDFESLRKMENPEIKFNMENKPGMISSQNDLKKLILGG